MEEVRKALSGMGFVPSHVEAAVTATRSSTVGPLLDWLYANPQQPKPAPKSTQRAAKKVGRAVGASNASSGQVRRGSVTKHEPTRTKCKNSALAFQLREMGYEQEAAERALAATSGKSIDEALDWILQYGSSHPADQFPGRPQPAQLPAKNAASEVLHKPTRRWWQTNMCLAMTLSGGGLVQCPKRPKFGGKLCSAHSKLQQLPHGQATDYGTNPGKTDTKGMCCSSGSHCPARTASCTLSSP